MPQSPEPRPRRTRRAARRPGMVDWYSVPQLAATGARTLFSTLLGSNIDSRRVYGADAEMWESVFDYSEPRPGEGAREAASEAPFSLAYLADTGDGWDATYTMAYLVTAPSLPVDGEPEPLPAAPVVVLGGDEVYPVASAEAYRRRLLDPFATAAAAVRSDFGGGSMARRDLFLLPGNHDWYDSLASLSSRFFSYRHPGSRDRFGRQRKPRRLGQFLTHQARSYFVLRLPRNWEIWAVDVQLGEDIDTDQRAFFAWHAESIDERTRVLLCCAIPSITYGMAHEGSELLFGLERIRNLAWQKGARTYAQVAGDVHHYERYVTAEETRAGEPYERQQFVCGGGGAFLHPTHSFVRGPDRIEPVKRYPSRATSRRLARRIPLFAFRHPGMSALIGGLYLLLLWGVPTDSGSDLAAHLVARPMDLLLAVAVVALCALFAGGGARLWGAAHGIAHLGGAVGAWALGGAAAARVGGDTLARLVEQVVTLGSGALVGGTIFGLYLWASLDLRRIHHNEAFSTLGWPHHKSLLHLTVETDGALTVRALGVERTAGEEAEHPVAVHLVEKVRVGADGSRDAP